MNEKTRKRLAAQGFTVNAAGNIEGTLPNGLKIGEKTNKAFEIREAFGEDLFAAENEADAAKPLTYSSALLCRQLVRVGDYEGPFSLALIGKLKTLDLSVLRAAQVELDKLGEG